MRPVTTGTEGDTRVDPDATIEMIRDRLAQRADLFEDRHAYEDGVTDALQAVRSTLLHGNGEDGS